MAGENGIQLDLVCWSHEPSRRGIWRGAHIQLALMTPVPDPYAVPVIMAHYDIFRHHLWNKFPGYGHALWDPNPGNSYPAVEIGDVGFICEGKFCRLFNALLPADHPSHRNFGVPEYHEPPNIGNHIDVGTLSPHNFYSAGVTLGPELDPLVDGPKKEGEVTFLCPKNQGAVLCLPIEAKREDTVAITGFGQWMVKHIDWWFTWASQLELGVDRMEDIVLVTGTHRTRSCTNVAFPGGQEDAQVSFGAKVDRRGDVSAIDWQFSQECKRGVVLNRGPDGQNLPEDQCIFVRGFRVARKVKILPRIKGAAGPSPDPRHNEEPDVKLLPIPAAPEYHDPLHIILDFIAETTTEDQNCDMILVHDDDLAQLHDEIRGLGRSECATTAPLASLDSLKLDALLSHLQSIEPNIHMFSFHQDQFPAEKSECDSDATEIVWVATLSSCFHWHNLKPQWENLKSQFPLCDASHKYLFIDGYISQTFGPHRAQQYFPDLLKTRIDSLPPIESLSYPNSKSHSYQVGPITRHIPIRRFHHTSSPLLDRSVVSGGSVISQTMWSPYTIFGKKQHVEEAVLQMPIFFEGIGGKLGLSLHAAAAGICDGLRNAQQFAPLGGKATAHIRIHWLGYICFKHQIRIRVGTSEDKPITISRFAHHVGRCVDEFLKFSHLALEPGHGYTDDIKREQWRIGPGCIQRNDIVVIGAIHVSAGSWMPLLQLQRHIP